MRMDDEAREAIRVQKPLSDITDDEWQAAYEIYGPCWCGQPIMPRLSESSDAQGVYFKYDSACRAGHGDTP